MSIIWKILKKFTCNCSSSCKFNNTEFDLDLYDTKLSQFELKNKDISFIRELEMPIFYEGHKIGSRRVDFLIEKKVLVELKALIKLEDVHLAQALNYLTAYNFDIGLLINFGATKLEFKRLFKKH